MLAMLPRMTTLFSDAALTGSSGLLVPLTLLFCSSTSAFAATCSASVWWAVLWICALVIVVYETLLAGSNSPVCIRTVKTRVSAESITPSLRMPALIAAWMFVTVFSKPEQFSAVPARSAYAWPPATAETFAPVVVFVQVALEPWLSVVQPGGAQS